MTISLMVRANYKPVSIGIYTGIYNLNEVVSQIREAGVAVIRPLNDDGACHLLGQDVELFLKTLDALLHRTLIAIRSVCS
jgi:hypothetical protein